ncbi:quinon protein alcohol dehydrogenase-like superfamily [Aspergillus germanicus]
MWDPVEGVLLWTIEDPELSCWVESIIVSPDNLLLASAYSAGVIKLQDTATGCLRQELRIGDNHKFTCVAFSPDGRRLASSTRRGVQIWNLDEYSLTEDLQCGWYFHSSVIFAPDGHCLAASFGHEEIKIWDATENLHDRISIEGHDDSLNFAFPLVFLSHSRLLVSGFTDNSVKLWDVKTGESRMTLEGYSSQLCALACSSDDLLLVSGDADGIIRVFDLSAHVVSPTVEGQQEHASQCARMMAFAPDGRVLASSDHYKIHLWSSTEGWVARTLSRYYDYVECLSFSRNGQLLASGYINGTVKVWNLTTDQEPIVLEASEAAVLTVAFSSDGHRLTSSYSDGTIRLWDLKTGSLQEKTRIGIKHVQVCALFSDDNLIALDTGNGEVQVWDIRMGELKWNQKEYRVGTLSIAPDGRWLSTGSMYKNTKIWHSRNGRLRQTLHDHFHVVWAKDDVMLSVFRKQWLCINREKKLWIPGEYSPTCLAVENGIIGIGHAAGVLFLALKDIEKL